MRKISEPQNEMLMGTLDMMIRRTQMIHAFRLVLGEEGGAQ